MSASTEWHLDQRAAELYESVLVPWILGPAARVLVDHACPSEGARVLDVGCGTGAAARYAFSKIGRSGHVVGVDLNPAMLGVARRLQEDSGGRIEWLEGNALDIPGEEGSFDVVFCAQTVQFVPEKVRAITEMRRVLQPYGRVAISAWSEIGRSPYFQSLVESMSKHIGPGTARGLEAAFYLSDATELGGLLEEGGFSSVEVEELQFEITLPPVQDFVPEHIGATPMSIGYGSATRKNRERVLRDVERAMTEYSVKEGVRVPFSTHVATAFRDR